MNKAWFNKEKPIQNVRYSATCISLLHVWMKTMTRGKKIYIFFMSKENTSFINNNLKMRPSNAL